MNQAEAEELIRKAQERIKDANIEIQQARDLLAKEPEPWEPKYTDKNMDLVIGSRYSKAEHSKQMQDYGICFPNKEEAQKAFHWFRFHHRLYQLALEFNGEGRRNYYVTYSLKSNQWKSFIMEDNLFSDRFFTRKGAEKAVEIMNRDGWRLPEETP